MVVTSPLSYGLAFHRRSTAGAEVTGTTSFLSVMAFLKILLKFISNAPGTARVDHAAVQFRKLATAGRWPSDLRKNNGGLDASFFRIEQSAFG